MKGNLQNIQPCKKLRDHFKMISVSVFFLLIGMCFEQTEMFFIL